jgi:hypothetical protein
MDLTAGGRLTVLRQGFQLSFHKLPERAILKTFDDGSCPLRRHIEHAFARHQPAGIVDLSKKRGFFNRRTQQSQRTYRGSARVLG